MKGERSHLSQEGFSMSSALKRLHSATGTVALVLALLALVASAAGVGYAAAQIGTNDIQNNAVTAKKIAKNAVTSKKIKKNSVTSNKVKNGSLKNADLVREEKARLATLGNGGQGDCVWQSADTVLPGYNIGAPTLRKDRQGVVHLSGLSVPADGAGGDADCDPSDPGQISDGIAFILPAGYIPAKSIYSPLGGGIIVGAQGAVLPGGALPAGAVFGSAVILDGLSFDAAGSGVAIAKTKASGRYDGSLGRLELQ
jgi:hypothetical protein